MSTYIINIQKYSIHDGDGIRTTVFFKGCGLSCQWCHNVESQKYNCQIMVNYEKCTNCQTCINICPQKAITFQEGLFVTDEKLCLLCGKCQDFCINNAREIVGKEMSVKALLKELLKDRMFYEQSGGGVTLSGGEVCSQDMEYIVNLCKLLKREGIHICIDTCGFAPYENYQKLLPYADVFLYDVKHMDSEKHRQYTGQGNELILENLVKLSNDGANINIRIPTIENVNADEKSMEDIIEFIKTIKVSAVNLLPYHNTGSHKYEKLNLKYKGEQFETPSEQKMEYLKNKFIQNGFNNVKIGG